MKKSSIYYWFVFSLFLKTPVLNAQTEILVDPNFVALDSKAGFNLIFEDHFNGIQLNRKKWDISTSKPMDDNPCYSYLYDFMLKQISVSNGKCIIKTEKATAQNSNCDPFNQGCESGERGIAGEIKTAEWREYTAAFPADLGGEAFQNYNFPVGSYVEIRAKTPDVNCNAGAGFWLFGGDQEIDVFESVGPDDADKTGDFTGGYWSGRFIDGWYYNLYKRYPNWWDRQWNLQGKHPKIISFGFRFKELITIERREMVWDDIAGAMVERIITVAQAGRHINPHDCFVTYGVQYHQDGIDFFINNQLLYCYRLASYNSEYFWTDRHLIGMNPKTIRLSTGAITGAGSRPCTVSCPSEMEVDYVKVFLPQKLRAIEWHDNRSVICVGREEIIKATYLPGVIYAWNSTGFDIENEWFGSPDSYVRIKPKPTSVAGNSYPVTLIATFPDGHTETLNRTFFLSSATSVAPPTALTISCERGSCFAAIGETPTGCDCSTPNIYEWSSNNGLTWNAGRTFFEFPYESTSNLCVRTRNCSGVSTPICKTVPNPIRVPSHSRISVPEIKPILYPNPANDFILLQNIAELDEMQEETVDAVIFDALGKIYFKNIVPKNEPIDISKLPNGIFVLEIKFGKISRKLIKFTKIKS